MWKQQQHDDRTPWRAVGCRSWRSCAGRLPPGPSPHGDTPDAVGACSHGRQGQPPAPRRSTAPPDEACCCIWPGAEGTPRPATLAWWGLQPPLSWTPTAREGAPRPAPQGPTRLCLPDICCPIPFLSLPSPAEIAAAVAWKEAGTRIVGETSRGRTGEENGKDERGVRLVRVFLSGQKNQHACSRHRPTEVKVVLFRGPKVELCVKQGRKKF